MFRKLEDYNQEIKSARPWLSACKASTMPNISSKRCLGDKIKYSPIFSHLHEEPSKKMMNFGED